MVFSLRFRIFIVFDANRVNDPFIRSKCIKLNICSDVIGYIGNESYLDDA